MHVRYVDAIMAANSNDILAVLLDYYLPCIIDITIFSEIEDSQKFSKKSQIFSYYDANIVRVRLSDFCKFIFASFLSYINWHLALISHPLNSDGNSKVTTYSKSDRFVSQAIYLCESNTLLKDQI